MPDQEKWLPVPGWGDYSVSDLGCVMSRKGKRVKILNPYLNGDYPSVTLRANGRRQIRTVHVLVAEAFHGPRPLGLEVRHIDGDPSNPVASNLRYGTHAENMQDRLVHGRHPMAAKTHCKRDHEFTDENTRVYRGSRFCRACKRLRENAATLRAAGIEVAA